MIKNLILLTGEDDFRLAERVNFYKTHFRKKYPDGEIVIFGKENSFSELEISVLTPNLFGGKRLVFAVNFWDSEKFERAEKSDFFERLPECDCAVFVVEPSLDRRLKFSKFLLANAKKEVFEQLDESELVRWVENFSHKKNTKISRKNAQFLVRRCGGNCWNLSREIEKLSLAGDGEITEKLIQNFTISHPRTVIWNFLDDLSRKKTHAALKNFRELLQMGESVHQIFAMICREVRIHAQIRSGLDQGFSLKKITEETGLNQFVAQKTAPATRNFSAEKIEKMYDALFEIDRRMKTGGMSLLAGDSSELELAIEKFVVEMS